MLDDWQLSLIIENEMIPDQMRYARFPRLLVAGGRE